jgi:hydrogenase nickel incorporation protein HypA/HybF
MHEYHIVEGILAQIIQTAKNNHAAKVSKVSLVMGELSGFEDSSIRLYFDNLSQGTIVQGAELMIKTLPAKLKCAKCDMVFERRNKGLNCPKCGSPGTLLRTGNGLYIENIEVESP